MFTVQYCFVSFLSGRKTDRLQYKSPDIALAGPALVRGLTGYSVSFPVNSCSGLFSFKFCFSETCLENIISTPLSFVDITIWLLELPLPLPQSLYGRTDIINIFLSLMGLTNFLRNGSFDGQELRYKCRYGIMSLVLLGFTHTYYDVASFGIILVGSPSLFWLKEIQILFQFTKRFLLSKIYARLFWLSAIVKKQVDASSLSVCLLLMLNCVINLSKLPWV